MADNPGLEWHARAQAEGRNKLITMGTLHDDTAEEDPRLRLQHDRDRVVWSRAFRRLADKTQVFPRKYGDHHRSRLTHSLEVMQLATSASRTLGLNDLLSEAIALAHDLGHTPFGHAGEDALATAFEKLKFDPHVNALRTFTHYEQGVDVVSYIDTRDPLNAPELGLKLSPTIREGILKHTYDHVSGSTEPKSLDCLLRDTKHAGIKQSNLRHGTVEAQLVRLCDKISYMISDIEDGFRIGALHSADLKPYEFLKAACPSCAETELDAFRRARSDVLKRVMNSMLIASASNLAAEKTTPKDQLTIGLGTVEGEVRGVYESVQKSRLFEHFLVKRAYRQAQHVVSCLFCQYLMHPELLPWPFRSNYHEGKVSEVLKVLYDRQEMGTQMRFDLAPWHDYLQEEVGLSCSSGHSKIDKEIKGRKLGDLIAAKDYVAGMTDNFATACFRRAVCCSGSKESWRAAQYDEWDLRTSFGL